MTKNQLKLGDLDDEDSESKNDSDSEDEKKTKKNYYENYSEDW